MKIARIVLLLCAVCLMAQPVFAGGSWRALAVRQTAGGDASEKIAGYPYEFTSDAADASVDPLTVTHIGGFVSSIDVEFDAVVPPDNVVVVLKSRNGVTLETSSTLTASGRVKFDTPQEIPDGFIIDPAVTGNSKKAKVVLNVFGN
jgi:hypothetical protein